LEAAFFFYKTNDDSPELMVILNLINFVQFAHARHSSSKLSSALAQSQISGSVRGEGQEKARCQMLKQVYFVQFAHARHSSSKLGSALAQSQISA
jgi:hypothetical protein